MLWEALVYESRLVLAVIGIFFITLLAKSNRTGAILITVVLAIEAYSCTTLLASAHGFLKSTSVCGFFLISLRCFYPVLIKAYIHSLDKAFSVKRLFPEILFPIFVLIIYTFSYSSPSFSDFILKLFMSDYKMLEMLWFSMCYGYCLFSYYSISLKSDKQLEVRYLKYSLECFKVTYSIALLTTILHPITSLPKYVFAFLFLPAKFFNALGLLCLILSFCIGYLVKSYLSKFNISQSKYSIFAKKNKLITSSATANTQSKYTNQNDNEAILRKINETLEEGNIYRNPDVRLVDLSNKLGLSERKISKVIKDMGEVNFRHFINQKRVAFVIEQLKNTIDKPNLLALSLEAGFNSKSSFNRAFKANTSLNPTEYINNKLNEC
ncbi:helix-turn-helix domain-containing protein [Aliikangiella sp. IMCC44359]|uniref:helix-turn-helix domain-containing protein n=1 Tax=Aliikangiella sp. IMCC44359 TaxID=3459125 RepID=UPI00403AEC56